METETEDVADCTGLMSRERWLLVITWSSHEKPGIGRILEGASVE